MLSNNPLPKMLTGLQTPSNSVGISLNAASKKHSVRNALNEHNLPRSLTLRLYVPQRLLALPLLCLCAASPRFLKKSLMLSQSMKEKTSKVNNTNTGTAMYQTA